MRFHLARNRDDQALALERMSLRILIEAEPRLLLDLLELREQVFQLQAAQGGHFFRGHCSISRSKKRAVVRKLLSWEGRCVRIRSRRKFCVRRDPRWEHDRNFAHRSEEHTSELQSHSFISYAVFC